MFGFIHMFLKIPLRINICIFCTFYFILKYILMSQFSRIGCYRRITTPTVTYFNQNLNHESSLIPYSPFKITKNPLSFLTSNKLHKTPLFFCPNAF